MQKPYIVVFAYGKFVLCTNSQMLDRHNKRKPISGRMEDFMKYEVTYCVNSEEIYQFISIQYISLGFTHLTIALQKPWMSKYLFWKWKIQCHQEDWPVNSVETDNILSDQM